MLEEGTGRLESASEVSTSAMRLKLEVEEKKQALVLLQRALVTPPPVTVRHCPVTAGVTASVPRSPPERALSRVSPFLHPCRLSSGTSPSGGSRRRRRSWGGSCGSKRNTTRPPSSGTCPSSTR